MASEQVFKLIPNAERPFGVDLSSWSGTVDWAIIASHFPTIHFAIMRATLSTTFTDPFFLRNWTAAKRFSIPRMAYHFLYPDCDPSAQMTYFLAALGGDLGELPLCLDVEVDHGQTKDKIRDVILDCAAFLKQKTGRNPVIYSRALWIDYYVTGGTWLNDFDWWLAQYLLVPDEHPGPVLLPAGLLRERCIIHQTTSHGPPIGIESLQMDYDRWQFDLVHLQKFIGKEISFADTLTQTEKIDRLCKAHPELFPEVKPIV